MILSLHRLRAQLMKTRIMQSNELRGLLHEFGIVLPKGHAALRRALPGVLAEAKTRLPGMLTDSLDEQVRRIQQLQANIDTIERRLSQQMREIPVCKAAAEIPGVGLLTATAVVASMACPQCSGTAASSLPGPAWYHARAAPAGASANWASTKRGDSYLRTLLMHGARVILLRWKNAAAWP